jgi:hypothetical protein
VTAGFGEYYVNLVFITSCLLWAVAIFAVRYSKTALHKYVEFTQRINLRILPAFDIRMFNILQLFLAISNDPHSMLLTSGHYSSQKCLIYVTLNWRYDLYVSGQIKHLNMKLKFTTKEHFCLYNCYHECAVVMIQMNVSHTDTTLWIFYTSGRRYKGEQ